MPDKQRVLEIVTAMPESASYEEIVQAINIWYSDKRASDDINAGRFCTTEVAKQRVRNLFVTPPSPCTAS